MIDLSKYGWNDSLNRLKQESIHRSLSHGRISVVHRTCYGVVSENGLFMCGLAGNMLYGKPDFELPCTGDWVLFQAYGGNEGIIVDTLPRERTLYRKKNGTIADRQAIASHVNKAFIVQSIDGNFNVRRIERFIVQLLEENIDPVLVLNKTDLSFDMQKTGEELKRIADHVPLFFTSIHRHETVIRLRKYISEGETVVFAGSSGVGKSSLINALCEKTVLPTSDISQFTGKGRHTSTRREMVLMNDSCVLIDTPGIREFGLAVGNTDSIEETLDISEYSKSCRFNDCSHTNEPGCAVLEAVNSGILDKRVYESYRKLRREAWHFSASEQEKRKKDKHFSKLVDEVKKRKADR